MTRRTRFLARARVSGIAGVAVLLVAGAGRSGRPERTATDGARVISQASAQGPTTSRELGTFVDSVIRDGMARERIPGAVFFFVKDGRVLLMKGYGVADVERRRPVVPESTIWRVGSISKVFTSVALVQLADRGRLAMNEDVNRYLRRVRVPEAYGEPVTAEQLLAHTAGFDEIRPGTQATTAAGVLPLAEFLRPRLARVRPPGRTISYSTYGITLAGELVEELSGLPFEEYMARSVWRPLGMSRTSITVPSAHAASVAVGYELRGDSLVPQPWEWYHTTPASSVNSTARDMARFAIALLGGGAIDGRRIVSERAVQYMQRQHATMHPRLPGFALGFYEDYVGTLRVLEHGGNMAGFSSLLVLIPEANAALFVANHREPSTLRDAVKEAVLARYYPGARQRHPVPTPTGDAERLARFAGRYAPTLSCHTCNPRRVPYVLTVTANGDGTLGFTGKRWLEAEPLLFVREDGTGHIAFRADSSGSVTHLFAGGFWSFERLR